MDLSGSQSSLVVGHRGLRLEYPDNTKEGILAAAAVCDMVEFDVRRTRDGVAILAHDPDLGGTAISDLDWPTVAAFDLGGGLHPARLDDVLDGAGGVPFNFEIKNSPGSPGFDETFGFAQQVAGRASKRDLVTSFHWPTVDAVHAAYPCLSTGLLIDLDGSLEDAERWAIRSGHGVVAPHWSLLGDQPAAAMSNLIEAGLQVVVWTVNDGEFARRLAAGGALAIITDDPARIRAAVEEETG